MSNDGSASWRQYFLGLRRALLDPQVDSVQLDRALSEARSRLSLPVVWLIGKTQSGKTSIVRALTGSPDAEIGTGFKPCTRTSRLYEFPPEAPVVRFLDTRGLGEVAYDPADDLRVGESHAHLLLAVLKAGDLDQSAVLDVLRAVRSRHPEWPVVIAQTSLHELYAPEAEHPDPYPFDRETWPASVPSDLVRALMGQRETLGALPGTAPVRWVPVDLTQAADGYSPANYGLEALWEAIETVSAFHLQSLLRNDSSVRDVFAQAAHPHIVGYAMAAGGVGALPLVDVVGVPAIQAKMLRTLATIHRQRWSKTSMMEFLGLLGFGIGFSYAARFAGRELLKLIPWVGQTGGALWGATASASLTYALGKAAGFYFSRRAMGISTDRESVRRVFKSELASGADVLRDSLRSKPQ